MWKPRFVHWRWFIAMVGTGLAMPICAQTAERPEWKVGDTWTVAKTVGPITFNPAVQRYQQKYTITEVRQTYYRGNVVNLPLQGTGGEETSTIYGNVSRD